MKMKPRVVLKKPKAAHFRLEAASGFDGIGDTKPARVTGVEGVPLLAGTLIGRVARFYSLGYDPRSRKPAGFTVDLVAPKQEAAVAGGSLNVAGGSLNIVGTFTSYHTGKTGKVLGARGTGYAVTATGAFALDVLSPSTPVTMDLSGDGRTWTMAWEQ